MKKAIHFFILFCIATAGVGQNWDINTLKKLNDIDNKFVTQSSKFLGRSTPYVVVGVPIAMGVYALIDKDQQLLKDAIYIGTSVIEAAGITYGLKYAIGRDRPYEQYPDRITARTTESSPSFPSNHTSAAFALATSLSITYPKWYVITPSALWACSVGFARMNEGVHYPTDVLGGAALGAGCAVANIYVNKWLNKWLFPENAKRKFIIY